MNLKELKEMVNLMNDNGLAELEVEQDGVKIKLKKTTEPGTGAQPITYTIPTIPVAPPKAVEATLGTAVAAAVVAADKGHLKDIKSPMVGTFYRAPSPEAAPFAEIGQAVEVGQVVCIVEAMKLMNEIKSEVRGKIVEVCVDNGEPVEFGQVLFRVDPAK
ncbi:MAG: acetyl-CoA carboxylase biotin carboxyl carrier protein [Candidatus Omnitrophica bacterium]|nr:acetyl-CoA carboxylase biotin carboxyl carrier protein [Candidatus Omnitrophota bacterium]